MLIQSDFSFLSLKYTKKFHNHFLHRRFRRQKQTLTAFKKIYLCLVFTDVFENLSGASEGDTDPAQWYQVRVLTQADPEPHHSEKQSSETACCRFRRTITEKNSGSV
jgi:hypothetical protein